MNAATSDRKTTREKADNTFAAMLALPERRHEENKKRRITPFVAEAISGRKPLRTHAQFTAPDSSAGCIRSSLGLQRPMAAPTSLSIFIFLFSMEGGFITFFPCCSSAYRASGNHPVFALDLVHGRLPVHQAERAPERPMGGGRRSSCRSPRGPPGLLNEHALCS